MNHFDVQRVESLMRYAEFLESVGYEEYMDDVINLLHGEIVGIDRFKELDAVSKYTADEKVIHQEYSIHPEVKKYIQEQIKRSMPEVYETKVIYDDGKLVSASYETLHPKLRYYVQQEIKKQMNN